MTKGFMTIALIAASATMASAQVIDVGDHTSSYTGFTRGFWYDAPVDHTIIRLELPTDLFATGDLASYVVEVNDIIQNYTIGVAGAIVVDIDVFAGDRVLIIGNWTTGTPAGFNAKNSYHNSGSPYVSSILGNPVDLFRGGFQSNIGDGTYTDGAGFNSTSGSHGRIFVTVIPAPASLALLGLGGLVAIRRRR